MKLIECRNCGDLFNLSGHEKKCECGQSRGAYIDNVKAWVSGPVVVLGIVGSSYAQAQVNHEYMANRSRGWRFDAFIVPDNSDHVERR